MHPRHFSNKLAFLLVCLVLALPTQCLGSGSDHEENLPSFFDESLNYIIFFGGIGFVVVSSVIAVILCRIGERRKKAGEGLL